MTALLTNEGVRVTPDVKDAVWTALQSLASAPRQERTLTLRRGFTLSPEDRVLVVEDVVTTAGSTRETIAVAVQAGAKVVVTDNRRHFLAALRYGIRVETPSEFLAGLKPRRA